MEQSLKFTLNSTISVAERKARAFGVSFVPLTSRFKNLEIKDIPIMITNENELLCIPKTDEVKHWGVTGQTGTLKTMLLNAGLSWDYWHIGTCCINFNDYQMDSFEWSFPTDSYIYLLNKFHIKPRPSPIVYVFPSTKTLQMDKRDERFPNIKMTIPLEEAIKNVKDYWKLEKAEKYLVNIMEDLIECTSIGEIKNVIDENFPDKNQSGLRFKLLNIFQTFFTHNMLNVSVPEAPAYLEYGDKYGNTYHNYAIPTLIRAGLIPSIQTSDLRNQPYFSAYMRFILENIYDNQYHDEYFKDKKISLFVDEIDKLWMGDNGHLIKESLGLIGTNGRKARIGLRWATQHYDKVPDQIRGNTKYLFISRKNDAKEVNEINKDFDIPKSMKEDILRLVTDAGRGIFEMVAVTTEKFAIYDLVTGERSYTSMAKRGFLIPPMARHRVPNINI
ncbi:type II restriction enzyme [Azospirillaceae bacterium]